MTKTERWDRYTSVPLLGLGLAFLVAYATPIIDPTLPGPWRAGLEAVEIATWAAFSIDFVVRLAISTDRWRFVRTHVLDLLAVLLPMLRPLRALRVLSIVILSSRRLSKLLRNRVAAYVVITAIAIWFIAGLAVTDAERRAAGASIHTVFDGWWWSFITMATVGYGDVYPVTLEGRLVGVALVVTGLALMGTITAYIASWFTSQTRETEEAIKETEEKIKAELDENEDKLVILSNQVAELRGMIERMGASAPADPVAVAAPRIDAP
jgi:voltage-gated potassium channel